MSEIAMRVAHMIDMLPDDDKHLAYEVVKKLVLAWDPDYTKVSPEEAERIARAENSGFVDETDIDWNNLNSLFT